MTPAVFEQNATDQLPRSLPHSYHWRCFLTIGAVYGYLA